MKLRNVALVLVAIGMFTVGCVTTTSAETCYELVEGDARTVLILQDGEQPSITVREFVGAQESAAPQTTLGSMEPNAFIYADGTRLTLTDNTLVWPEDSLLPNVEFTAADCPN